MTCVFILTSLRECERIKLFEQWVNMSTPKSLANCRARQKALGLCVYGCCQNKPLKERFCKEHDKAEKQRTKIRKRMRTNNGLCLNCLNKSESGLRCCRKCLDYKAIKKLPEKAQPASLIRAEETRQARIDGTYVCPILKLTEAELKTKFSLHNHRSVWEFDHKEDIFRDIISGQANKSLRTWSSSELKSMLDYVSAHELVP